MLNPEPSTQPARVPLYHYSDGNGLLGMLNTGKLWFSHIKYLNDAAEYSYALNLLVDVLKDYKDIGSQEHLQHAFETITDNERLQSHYSFSLTEEKDLLSQWRGYCPNGGYSFSINDQHIDQMCSSYKLTFERCLYNKDEQREFIINRIIGVPSQSLKQAADAEKEAVTQGRTFSKGVDYMTYGIMQGIIAKSHLLAFLKDPAFEEEKEWRMVASESTMGSTANYLRYRSSRNMFIPYLDLPVPARPDYNQSYNNLIIDEVRVSPTPHQDLALASCRMMMEHHQCKSVQSSAIPYRNW